SLTDAKEILQLRRWIECGIAARIAEQRPREVLDHLRTNLRATQQALRDGREDDYLAAIREFDHILAAGTGNTRAARILLDLYNIFVVIAATTLVAPGGREQSILEHQRIYDAISAGDLDGAIAATNVHIHSIERIYERWIPAQETGVTEGAGVHGGGRGIGRPTKLAVRDKPPLTIAAINQWLRALRNLGGVQWLAQ